jgi:predicted nucleotidyltransferase
MEPVKNILELERLLRKEKIFERYGINRIGVFGSFARGEKFNDIDLLIEDSLSLESAFKLKSELEEKLQLKVDIVLKKFAEPIILYRAMKDIQYAAAA